VVPEKIVFGDVMKADLLSLVMSGMGVKALHGALSARRTGEAAPGRGLPCSYRR
jgi:hypothetical protein